MHWSDSDLKARDLHDASLGTALDAIYDYGITELFFEVSSQILKQQGIDTCAMRRHLNLIDGGNFVTTVLMRVGPSGSVFRSRSQTTASGIGQESLW